VEVEVVGDVDSSQLVEVISRSESFVAQLLEESNVVVSHSEEDLNSIINAVSEVSYESGFNSSHSSQELHEKNGGQSTGRVKFEALSD